MAPAAAAAHEDPADPKKIDGTAIAGDVRAEVAAGVKTLLAACGKTPGLAVVLVGERKDSQSYVRSKKKACLEAGIESESLSVNMPETATEAEVLAEVERLNADERVHGILVQLPMPTGIDEERVLSAVSIEKDVDGFHPLNIGKLAMRGRDPLFIPCTPNGCMELLERSGVEISGKRAVVVGRSNIVGMPAALLLMGRNATVTVVHSKTPNPEEIIRQADIVVVACGRVGYVKGDWIKEGAAVIDVGINAVDDATKKAGYRLVGDVDYAACKERASKITPVPKGVGPMTIAMLLKNVLDGAARTYGVTI